MNTGYIICMLILAIMVFAELGHLFWKLSKTSKSVFPFIIFCYGLLIFICVWGYYGWYNFVK